MKRILFLGILISGLYACTSLSNNPNVEPVRSVSQPIIFFNGSILTMEQDTSEAEAIAVQDQKIVAIGANDEILALQGPQTLLVDLGGRTLMPGFVDAHTHVLNDARAAEMSLDEAQWLALRNGITTLGDLFVDESFLQEIRAFNEAGSLRVRTSLYLVYNDPCGDTYRDWYRAHPPTRVPGEMLRINGIKIFTDGGSCGRPALSFELRKGEGPGDLWMTQGELDRAVQEAQAAGYQVAIHAIGDRAVDQAQNAVAFALDGKPNVYRHRMEHISVLQPNMVARFQELGIIPVIPGEYPSCRPFGPPLPEAYQSWEWPWRQLRAESPDLNIAWHSDYPFASIRPFVHLYGFVTRQDVYQNYTCPSHVWLRDDTLTVEQALSIMTIQSAYALFREEEVGSLKPGKYADLIILTENPLQVDSGELLNINVIASMVGGRFEYCMPDHMDLCPGYEVRVPVPLPDLRPPVLLRWLMLLLIPALPGTLLLHPKFKQSAMQKFAWAAGFAGGLGWLAWLYAETSPLAGLIVVFALLLLSAFISGMFVHLLLNPTLRVFLGIVGLGLLAMGTGFVLSQWFKNDQGWFFWLIGMFAHITGLLLFGIANLRAQILPRLNFIPLGMAAAGMLSIVLSLTQASSAELTLGILVISLSCGWVLMAVSLITKRATL